MFSKCHFLVIKIKKNIFAILFLLFSISLLIFANNNLLAVKSGLTLWATSVVPTLFPFFVATELLMHTNIIYYFGKLLNKFMKPLFNIRGEGAFCFIMGLISGYPIGAKIASHFRKENICTKAECERLLSFTNNSGPLFIIGTVGISMFGNTSIGLLLFCTHILASFIVGFIFRFWKYDFRNSNSILSRFFKKNKNLNRNIDDTSFNKYKDNNFVKISNLGSIIAESITNSTSTILMIGGFIIIFSSIISIFKASGLLNIITVIFSPIFNFFEINTELISPIFTGLLEVTNGLSLIASVKIKAISINIILASFVLGFGGISVLLQVWSVISKTDLSIKPYFYGKLLQGFIASILTCIFINVFPFLNLDL